MIDFDEIDSWSPTLSHMLTECVPDNARREIAAANPEYVEDARALLFELTDRDIVLDTVISWLQRETLAGYHGSRLVEGDIQSIQENGLILLTAEHRRDRLIRALSPHPRWNELSNKLDDEIMHHGPGNRAGGRENQAHLTLSKSGVLNGFNHYLEYGSEFDQHVACSLLGQEGYDMLAADGKPYLIKVAVPGELALNAAHRYFSINDLRRNGDLPNIISDFLEAWSYRLAYPNFQSSSLEVDCGMVFQSSVPAEWIVNIEEI